MSNIKQTRQGYIYNETSWKDSSLLWSFFPNFEERFEVTDNNALILHGGDEITEYLIDYPMIDNGFVLQGDYNFLVSDDESESGGFEFKSVTDNYIRLESRGYNPEYHIEETYSARMKSNATPDNIKYFKIEINEDNVLSAYGAMTETWYDFGNTKINNMNKMGFYIGEGCKKDMAVNSFMIYKNNEVIFDNINEDFTFSFLNQNGEDITSFYPILRKGKQVIIKGKTIIYPIPYLKIEIRDSEDNIVSSGEFENIYGGDKYSAEYDVEFYLNNVLLKDKTYSLGTVSKYTECSLTVQNMENFEINNKTLKITYEDIYNKGYRLVSILDHDGTYKKEVKVDLKASDSKEYKIKIEADKDILTFDEDYKFNIVFE